MDSACWCHEAGKERRCWSQPDDCEVDRSCCADTHSCKSTPYASETCGKRTSDARKKRDAEPKIAPLPTPAVLGSANLFSSGVQAPVMRLSPDGIVHLPVGATVESLALRMFEVFGYKPTAVRLDCADCRK